MKAKRVAEYLVYLLAVLPFAATSIYCASMADNTNPAGAPGGSGGAGSGVLDVTGGTNVTITGTPQHPIINATGGGGGGVTSLTAPNGDIALSSTTGAVNISLQGTKTPSSFYGTDSSGNVGWYLTSSIGGGGSGSGTVNSGTANQVPVYPSTGNAVGPASVNFSYLAGLLGLGAAGNKGGIEFFGNTSGSAKLYAADATTAGTTFKLPAAASAGYLQSDSSGNLSIGTGATAGAANSNQANGFRLTLTSGTPVTTSDVTAATTIYSTPADGYYEYLYNGTSWLAISGGEISLATPAFPYRLYDVFAYNNSGTRAIEAQPWDSSPVTITVTNVTAANPPVVTATNSLSNGDIVFIDGITGTVGTDSNKGLNGKAVIVSSVSGTGFTATGMDTTGLTYTSGGAGYRVPTARTIPLAYQNGVLSKSTDTTRRYEGTFMTRLSGQTEDSQKRRLVFNYKNSRLRHINGINANGTNWSWASPSSNPVRPANSDTSTNNRCEVVTGLADRRSQFAIGTCGYNDTMNRNLGSGLGINSCVTPSLQAIMRQVGSIPYAASEFAYGSPQPPSGYSFLQYLDLNNTIADNTSNWATATNNDQGVGTTGMVIGFEGDVNQ